MALHGASMVFPRRGIEPATLGQNVAETSMPLLWRAMKRDGDSPQLGRGAVLLGVRVGPGEHDDVHPDEANCVHPGGGGMSVSPRVDDLPTHRLPRRLRDAYPERFRDASGPNTLHCWTMGDGPFVDGPMVDRLWLRRDPDMPETHGFVEPHGKMPLDQYEVALAATQHHWRRWEE